MKLKITDYFWSVGNPTRKVKTVYSSLEVGVIKEMGEITTWQIDDVGENFVKLSVIRHDGVLIREFTISKGNEAYWRPRSMDGGHEYRMKLVKFL